MRVIARAYKDKPLDRFATERIDGDHLAIGISPDPQAACVGFPVTSVYVYDDDLFRALEVAWSDGDASKLSRCWAKAVPVTTGDFR